jgi:hypothetical protein
MKDVHVEKKARDHRATAVEGKQVCRGYKLSLWSCKGFVSKINL